MGCCCLQMTFQAQSLEEARHLYDQLTALTPIMLALSAASPIWRGYLSDVRNFNLFNGKFNWESNKTFMTNDKNDSRSQKSQK